LTQRILVADDDANLREVVCYALTRDGFEVHPVTDGAQAVACALGQTFDLVVLDVLMPELDGLSACRQIRARSPVPILFLSSRGEEVDRVLGLDLGGDDYLTKPFSPRELVSRVRAILRRAAPAPSTPGRLEAGRLSVDLEAHRAWVDDLELTLTATEFRILAAMASRPGKAFSRSELLDAAYPDDRHVSDRTLDSHMRGVRASLRAAGAEPLETVQGHGWRLLRT
jgi:two-component system OmpR family response regulator